MKCNDLEEALKYALDSNTIQSNTNTLMLIANINKKLKRYTQSILTLKELIIMDDKNTQALLMLAGLYDNIKEYLTAISILEKILAMDNLKPKVILDAY
mmetsp:Transcript_28619/g.24049  ORF Transcript_28619/g.24049 Transcript_28619/m.24049 type:complete len:99 (+) Transcript_28619:1163-1459(+)